MLRSGHPGLRYQDCFGLAPGNAERCKSFFYSIQTYYLLLSSGTSTRITQQSSAARLTLPQLAQELDSSISPDGRTLSDCWLLSERSRVSGSNRPPVCTLRSEGKSASICLYPTRKHAEKSALRLLQPADVGVSQLWVPEIMPGKSECLVSFGRKERMPCVIWSQQGLYWAARYNAWLHIKLTPKGVVFSFLFSKACDLVVLGA